MTKHTPAVLALLAFGLTLSACGGASKSEKKDKAEGKDPVKDDNLGGNANGGIDIQPFAFGPYLAADASGFASTQVSVEFGFYDVREQKDGDKEDITDYRFKQAAAFVQKDHLPTK